METLREIGGQSSEDIDLARAALVLGALDRPHAELSHYLDHLDALENDVAAVCAIESKSTTTGAQSQESGTRTLTVEQKANALSQVLADEYAYNGDHLTYDDRRNANLLDVIDRRKGLPVSLGILYIHAARAQGWTINGLNFPGHFIIRLETEKNTVILDPFDGGRILKGDDLSNLLRQIGGTSGQVLPKHLHNVSNREILLRLQNNLKLRFLQGKLPEKAVEILERMRLLAPDEIDLLYELARNYARTGRLRAAETAFQECLQMQPEDPLKSEIELALSTMKRSLN